MSKSVKDLNKFLSKNWVLGLGGTLILVTSLGLAWFSSGFQTSQGWGSFLAVLALGGGLLFGGWRVLQCESPPGWLGGLLLGAAFLRLAAGVFWVVALPAYGHDSPAEQGGYVMADAYDRDQTAWELAYSEKPLTRAFQGGFRKADQYGGMLFLSAALYRYLGGETHQPLLMVVVTAAFSALAVPLTWAFTRRAWGDTVARMAAWGLALYPEAVLLGSSQMREAFTMTLAIAAFYGLVRYGQDRSWGSLGWVLGALILGLPFSPPVTALLVVMLGLAALFTGGLLRGGILRQRRLWLALGGLVLLVTVGIWYTWGHFSPEGVTNPLALVNWWVKRSAYWQAHLSERASGWMQKIFDSTPEGVHLPLLLAYGVVQPFLPAALVAISGAPIWRWIAIWRAVGWTLLLPFLLYAPLRSLRDNIGRGAVFSMRGLSLVVWLGILIASYRGGGDMWDNPRYRVVFASLQIALAAWAWSGQRRFADAWLRRALVGVTLVIAWFIPWYLRRYTPLNWPVVDFFKTLGLGIASSILYLIWDWSRIGVKPDE